ncbi:T9SS type A sorting domain-containing protein [Flavobacterium sp.]|uniref:T9SS type A sorting domain-containing protein n=1 Tax=Flavobacterium sp. TaxID=239 RepID=UPI00262376E5|nr:T9SS type A sorting domain-containing protein [Flavobacterium sp.]
MKNKIFNILAFLFVTTLFGQFSTGERSLGAVNRTIQIDTDPTTVTLTLKGPSDRWLGVGFGGNNMNSVIDMFIWSDSSERDFKTNGGHNPPTPDTSQSWTILSDNVSSGTRTVVATRTLVSAGDYTFTNNSSGIQIIFAVGENTTFGYHGANPHGTAALNRFVLSNEDFSLKSSSIYPNPSTGTFIVKTKTTLEKISIYTHSGSLVKTITLDGKKEENEINLADLQSGIYLFELQDGEDKAWKRVVLE